jgi:hypothetical protein
MEDDSGMEDDTNLEDDTGTKDDSGTEDVINMINRALAKAVPGR